jgi:hypothetical protein
MATLIHERVEAAQAGTNPTVIARVPSGWAVIADAQFLRGYSLLLADPVVHDLNALSTESRGRFLLDMALLGDALLEATGRTGSTTRSSETPRPLCTLMFSPATWRSPRSCAEGPPGCTTAPSGLRFPLTPSVMEH